MPLQLTAPDDDADILDFDAEALSDSALLTGDVFAGVTIAGFEDPQTVMIAGHPCTIRNGPNLSPRIACVRVVPIPEPIPYTRWPVGHWNKFPISEAVGIGLCAADLSDFVTVDSSELNRERRVLTLTDHGVIVFQQRLIHSLTRFVATEGQLLEACRHVLLEAELERDWIEGRLDNVDVADSVIEFHAFMNENGRRLNLSDPAKSSSIAKEVRAEIKSQSP